MKNFYNKSAILFDLDGTVINSSEGIYNALRYMFKKISVNLENEDNFHCFIGPSIHSTLVTKYSFDEKAADEAVEIYREYYSTKGLLECEAYSGIKELLIKLKKSGKKLALSTKKPEVFAREILDNLGLTQCFDAICGAHSLETNCSKVHIVARAVNELGVKNEDALLVGDTKYDVIGANGAKIDCLGVLYGFGTESEMVNEGVCGIAKDMDELTSMLIA